MAVEQAGQVGRKRKKIWLIRQNGERSMNQAVSSCRHSRFESECDSNAFRYRLLLLTQVLTATTKQKNTQRPSNSNWWFGLVEIGSGFPFTLNKVQKAGVQIPLRLEQKKQASERANKQASNQGSKQTNKQTNKHTNTQTRKQTTGNKLQTNTKNRNWNKGRNIANKQKRTEALVVVVA